MKFSCGHEGEIPRNMGRGKARQHRLEKYFARRCPDCARKAVVNLAFQLTHVGGEPYSKEERLDYIHRHPIGKY